MSTDLVTLNGSNPGGIVEPTDSQGLQLVIGTARRTPWLMLLPAGDQLALYYDTTAGALCCRRFGENANGTWTLGSVVQIVTVQNGGFAGFANPQKVVAAWLDANGQMHFAVSFNQGDTWTLEIAAG